MKLLLLLLTRLALSAAALFASYKLFRARGLATSAPVAGIALARPLVELIGGFPRFASRMALRKVAGRYFEWRGRSLDVHIDESAVCWVSTADARKVVALPKDAVLNRVSPLHCRETGEPRVWRITTAGLSQFLARATDADSAKFSQWLETDVARPARNRLEREGKHR